MDVRLILEAIKSYWNNQKEDRDPSHIGMSSLGHCGRQLAYKHHQVKGSDLDWRAKVIFDDGDMHHTQIRKAISEGLIMNKSCYGLFGEEEEVNLGQLSGHIDGALIHDSTNCNNTQHKDMLLEVKSMNDRGFTEFRRKRTLSFEYRAQVSAYLRAAALGYAYIIVKNKNNGDMDSMVYEGEDVLLDHRLDVLGNVLASEKPEDIRREYHADEAGELDWQCNYCPFVMLCWRHEGVVEVGAKKFKLVNKSVPQKLSDVTKIVTSNADITSNVTEKSIGTGVATVTNEVSEVKDNSVKNKRQRRKRRKG